MNIPNIPGAQNTQLPTQQVDPNGIGARMDLARIRGNAMLPGGSANLFDSLSALSPFEAVKAASPVDIPDVPGMAEALSGGSGPSQLLAGDELAMSALTGFDPMIVLDGGSASSFLDDYLSVYDSFLGITGIPL